MEIDRRELKQRARETMELVRPGFRMVTLVYLLMTTGVSAVLSRLVFWSGSETVSIFSNLLYMLYSTVVEFGLCLWALWTYQQLDPGLGALVQGFSVAGRVILMNLGILLRTLGWYLCGAVMLIFPLFLLLYTALAPLAALVFVLALLALLYAVGLRYALAPYLLADHPDDGSEAAIRRSVGLMKGWKWELFRLDLSFLGWILLSVALTALVDSLFLMQAGFFQTVAQTLDQVLVTPEVIQALKAEASAILSHPLCLLLSNLLPLPVLLWYVPHRAVSYAGFYDARTHLHNALLT